jgi:hypothetical protein
LEDDDIQFSRCVCYLLFLGAAAADRAFRELLPASEWIGLIGR